jgi:beta-lactamase class A
MSRARGRAPKRTPRKAPILQGTVIFACITMAALIGFQIGNAPPPREPERIALVSAANLGLGAEEETLQASPQIAMPLPTKTLAPAVPTATARVSTPTAAASAITAPTAIPPRAQQEPRPSSFSSTPFTPDPILAAKVAERLSGRSGRIGVAIKDLRTGRGVLIDPEGEYEAASLFKLSVMYEVFKQRELGTLSFDEQLLVTERHVAYDLGTLDRPAGSIIAVGEALERMITISDNSAAIILTDRVGALNINRDLQAMGLSHTHVLLDDLKTSPGDMLAFHEMLALGRGLSPETNADMVRLLSRQKVNDRIPRLLPGGTTVAHKTGNLPGVVNDVGIVYGPDASYIIAVLVDGTRDEGGAATSTAQIALDAYQYFSTLSSAEPIEPPPAIPSATPSSTPRPAATPTPLTAANEPPANLSSTPTRGTVAATPTPVATPTEGARGLAVANTGPTSTVALPIPTLAVR